ncbi:MAG: Signal recognition particle receptor FtsY [Flavobacteriaceae bacterium]|jgi:fused signal recognition particle receptor|nr:MAG: Signal recognition particle receptor FtsY [Flavobacteriaceae bacterium]
MGLFDKWFSGSGNKEALDKGLEKSKQGFFSKVATVVAGKKTIDAEVLDNLEEVLIASDVGVDTTLKIIDRLEARVQKDPYLGTDQLNVLLKDEIKSLFKSSEISEFGSSSTEKLTVIMVVGVNGVGKTTTIGKLAKKWSDEGKKVMLAAADTFRAAAVDQLEVWSERANVPLVKLAANADPAAVAYEAVSKAVSSDIDVLLVDTAGRLHNKINLMNELSKIKRVMSKVVGDAPHEVLLVLDGSTGQNAFEQAKQFSAATEVTSLAVTKLDGSAKGGVVLGISDQFNIPVRFIGVGEGIEDLQPFDAERFVDTFFEV